jgi:ketosteroid isomerase-like protein
MKHYIIFGLVSATLAGCGTGTSIENQTKVAADPQIDATTKPAIDVVEGFHNALATADTKQAMAHLADDVLIYEGGAAETSKAEYASHHLEADIAFLKGVKQSVSARSAQMVDDVAWVTNQGETKGTYKDKAIDSDSTETMVLRRSDGQWKIVHIHWSSADNKPKVPAL